MAERSHVLRRGERAAPRGFPAAPTLDAHACDGVAFILADGAPAPDLTPLRDRIAGLWRGAVGPDGPEVLIAVFAATEALDDAHGLPAALPLAAGRGGVLASFAERAVLRLGEAAGPRPDIRRLDLWWNGRRWETPLAALAAIPLWSLWPAPVLTVHRPVIRLLPGAPATGAAASPGGRLSKVRRARLPLRDEGPGLAEEMEGRVRALEDRTRLSAIFRQLFHRRTLGEGGGAGQGPWGRRQGMRPKEPGVLENLAGWLRWHTPLGNDLRRSYAERMALVERLIRGGDLDGALKLALSLASGKGKGPSRLPTRLPGARASLDFTINRAGGSAAVMAPNAYQTLRERYAALADQLEKNGDFRRAAYIRSKLMDEHHAAVLTLERGGLFRDAARLAIDSDQEPALAIRLLYKAGDRDAALAVARRAACFEQLAMQSRGDDPAFHSAVITAWTDILLATGQPLRALQVTDALAAGGALRGPRLRWLAAAAALDGTGGYDPEVAIRCLLAAPWETAPPGALDDFPDGPTPRDLSRLDGPIAWIRQVVLGESLDPPRDLMAMLAGLTRFGQREHPEQKAFWEIAAQPVSEALTRAILAGASGHLGPKPLGLIGQLLDKAQLPVLAAELDKITRLHTRPTSPGKVWRAPPVAARRPPVRHACLLGGGHILAWRDSRQLQLFDRHGAVAWQGEISDVLTLVPIGSSPSAILVQREADGACRLTRFSAHDRAFHPIGRVRLMACHDVTSESQWLVQIGGEIGALDLAKLCAAEPEIEFLWSTSLTERLRTLAFGYAQGAPAWITRDISPGREGVMEHWRLRNSRELVASVCLPTLPGKQATHETLYHPPLDWSWTPSPWGQQILSIEGEPRSMSVHPWSTAIEAQALNCIGRRAAEGVAQLDSFQSCDFGRPAVGSALITGKDGAGDIQQINFRRAHDRALLFTVEYGEDVSMACLARGKQATSEDAPGPALLADDAGRLIVVDFDTLTVAVI